MKSAKIIVDTIQNKIILTIDSKTEENPLPFPWGQKVEGIKQVLSMMGFKVELEIKQ
jgi:hypothetical protein